MFGKGLKCIRCGSEYPLVTRYGCPKCGGILDVEYEYAAVGKELGSQFPPKEKRGIWRFKDFLPVKNQDSIITLQEGDTPLFPYKKTATSKKSPHIYLKDETRNPTGSFKDRPISCAVSKTREERKSTVITSSSGNAGVAVATYAAKAGMRAVVLVPSTTPRNKLLSIVCSGATLIKVKGATSDCFALAKRLAREYGWTNLTSTFLNPFATEGDKTVAYELYEQLDQVPEWIVVPVGAGPLLVGIYKGYKELKALGFIDKLPSMVAVQAQGCAPIATAFERGQEKVKAWGTPRTIASGIADPLQGYSDDGSYVLRILKESGGLATAVDDDSLLKNIKTILRNTGIFAEPTACASVACLEKLTERGIFNKKDTVVCIVTGSGFKDTSSIEKYINIPCEEIEPDLDEVKNFLEQKLT